MKPEIIHPSKQTEQRRTLPPLPCGAKVTMAGQDAMYTIGGSYAGLYRLDEVPDVLFPRHSLRVHPDDQTEP